MVNHLPRGLTRPSTHSHLLLENHESHDGVRQSALTIPGVDPLATLTFFSIDDALDRLVNVVDDVLYVFSNLPLDFGIEEQLIQPLVKQLERFGLLFAFSLLGEHQAQFMDLSHRPVVIVLDGVDDNVDAEHPPLRLGRVYEFQLFLAMVPTAFMVWKLFNLVRQVGGLRRVGIENHGFEKFFAILQKARITR